MSKTRKLGFSPKDELLFWNPTGCRAEYITDSTDAEVADLLAGVLEAAGHEVPTNIPHQNISIEKWRELLLADLAGYRAALARDAEKDEREQTIEALNKELSAAVTDRDRDSIGAIEAATRRAYELGARPQGGA